MSISGNTVVVGASLAGNLRNGEAYVFVEPQSGWVDMTQTSKLITPTAAKLFGNSVSIFGKTVVVGAPSTSPQTAAFVFVRPNTGWATKSHVNLVLIPSDGVPTDLFGASVSVSGPTTIVGAFGHNSSRGAAYVFGR